MTDNQPQLVRVRVTSEWRAETVVEVPEELAGLDIMEWPVEYLDQVTAVGAELTDWSSRRAGG